MGLLGREIKNSEALSRAWIDSNPKRGPGVWHSTSPFRFLASCWCVRLSEQQMNFSDLCRMTAQWTTDDAAFVVFDKCFSSLELYFCFENPTTAEAADLAMLHARSPSQKSGGTTVAGHPEIDRS